tara:strand:- start:11917 stop:13161 length:1245 start_codon:yes stop_codon:yes gene_type:complete
MSSENESSSSDEEYCGDNGNIFFNEILNNTYITIKKIGYGAFSSVWLSYNFNDTKYYAIKIQNDEDYDEGIIESKYLTKIKKINSDFISNIIEYFIEEKNKDKYVCMVFNICSCNIYQLIRHERNKLNINNVKSIIIQTLKGLEAVHSLGYYHTDIKPENILFNGNRSLNNIILKKHEDNNFPLLYKNLKEKICKEKNLNITKSNQKKKFNKKYKNVVIKEVNLNILSRIIDDSNSDSESDSENDSDYKYTNEELTNINIKLTDFGTLYKNNEKSDDEIQTRYYRAPEVILGLVHNFKVDIWSIGCMTIELLLNRMLFDPKKDNDYDRDFYHLYDIQKLCGYIPDHMRDKSPNKSYYFKKKNFRKKIELSSIKIFLEENNIYSDELLEFLEKTLTIDYKLRPTATECLNLSWFN